MLLAGRTWAEWVTIADGAFKATLSFLIILRDALIDAFKQQWVAIRLWWRVGVLVTTPILRLLYHLWLAAVPYMKMGGQAVADHLKSQEPKVLAGYALFIAAVIGFILLRRLLRRLRVWDRITGYCRSVKLKYQANIRERQHAFERRCDLVKHKFTRMQNKVRHYSKLGAEGLPHGLYVLAAVVLTWIAPGLVRAASQELVLNSVSMYVPAIRAFLFLQQENVMHSPEYQRSRQQHLSYWATLAALLALRSLAHQLVVGRLVRLLPYTGEADLFFSLWLILPFGGGAMMDAYLLPLLKKHLGLVLQLFKTRDEWANRVIPILTFCRLLSEDSSRRLRRHLDDVPVLVVCLLFTANFMMAGMGVVIVALLLPAIGTLREMGEARPVGPSWLQYWVVYALSRLFLWPLPLAYLLELWYYTWVLLPSLDWLPWLDGRGKLYNLLTRLYHEGATRTPRGQPPSASRSPGGRHVEVPRARAVDGATRVLASGGVPEAVPFVEARIEPSDTQAQSQAEAEAEPEGPLRRRRPSAARPSTPTTTQDQASGAEGLHED